MTTPTVADARPLVGKVALVTGGSRGLGAATAIALADAGASVAISYTADASDAKAAAIVAAIADAGGTAVAIKADQAVAVEVDRLVAGVIQAFGKLDILVNNAAVAWLGEKVGSDGYDAAAMDRQWAINTLGVVATIRAAARVIQDGGRIVSISSGAGSRAGNPGIADYAGTKAAINGFSRGVAHDLAGRNVTVNVIQAGVMDTDMAAPYAAGNTAMLATLPIKRAARLDEVVAGILFLTSPAASYITGSIIDIEGGFGA